MTIAVPLSSTDEHHRVRTSHGNVNVERTAVASNIIVGLGIERECSRPWIPGVFAWYVKTYGPEVNLSRPNSDPAAWIPPRETAKDGELKAVLTCKGWEAQTLCNRIGHSAPMRSY